jgi:AraC-like DNA-binding protein
MHQHEIAMTKHFSYADSIEDPRFRFKISLSTLEAASFPVHSHDFNELVIIFGGTGLHVTEAGMQPLVAGDVMIIKSGVSHGFDACRGLKLCNIMYDPDDLLPDRGDVLGLAGYYALFVVEPTYAEARSFRSNLHLDMVELQELGTLTAAMLDEIARRRPGYESMIRGYFMQLVVYLARRYAEIVEQVPASVLQIARVVMLLENTSQERLRLDELAETAHLSKTQLLRLFKATYQLSPIQYMLRLRIARACHLLKQRGCAVSRAAFESGFNDSNYFSRQFRKVMGMSPTDYRHRHYFAIPIRASATRPHIA